MVLKPLDTDVPSGLGGVGTDHAWPLRDFTHSITYSFYDIQLQLLYSVASLVSFIFIQVCPRHAPHRLDAWDIGSN